MILRTSPRTSAVRHPYIGVHRACPSPPYTPLSVTRTQTEGTGSARFQLMANTVLRDSWGRFAALSEVHLHAGSITADRSLGLRREAA